MESLSWVSHPAKLRKVAAAITLLLIIAIMVVVYNITQSWVMLVFAYLLFNAALSSFYFPTRFEVSQEKVKIKYTFTSQEKDMSMFRSYYTDKRGVLLSPFSRPNRLENFRGVYLRYHNNKDEVDAFIKTIFDERMAEAEKEQESQSDG